MGIQFKQVDNLTETFDVLSGDLQSQITTNEQFSTGMSSGDYGFFGDKTFSGSIDILGSQGVYVPNNSIYTDGYLFTTGISIGFPILSPRSSTFSPLGAFQVTGGQIYFEDTVNIRSDSNLIIDNGFIQTQTGIIQTGSFEQVNTSGAMLSGEAIVSGDPTGFLKLYNIPDYTETGSIPSPASGTVFRSGHHLMIV